MSEEQFRQLIERYITAYNSFDIEGLVAPMHPGIHFVNWSEGKKTVETRGLEQFTELAQQSSTLFESREQVINPTSIEGDRAIVEVEFRGILAVDLPSGLRAGDNLQLSGRTELEIKDGKFVEIADFSQH